MLFRRYTTLHILITIAAFSIAAVWIGISGSRHNTAKSNCEQKFFTAASDITSEGETMCQIFPWVDIGLMAGLWVLLAISQVCHLLSFPAQTEPDVAVLLYRRFRIWYRPTRRPREIQLHLFHDRPKQRHRPRLRRSFGSLGCASGPNIRSPLRACKTRKHSK